MSILWLIIKVMLLIILIIVLCLAFILVLLLTVPIKYSCLYENYDTNIFQFKVGWLRLIEGKWMVEGDVQESRIKIAWFTIYHDSTDHFKEVAKERLDETAEQTEEVSKKAVKETTGERISHQALLGKVQAVKELLADDRFSSFSKNTLQLIWEFVKYIKPYDARFELIIGDVDPADTGELIAKLTLLYPWYYPYGIIEGSYDEAGMWGNIWAKGRFRLISFVRTSIRYIMDKETREYIRLLINIGKES